MDIPKSFQSKLKLKLNEEYNKQTKTNQESQETVKESTKQALIDKVVLTTVDSSSFDKYVEQMENGKKTVANKFIGALETFADKFIDGLNNVTKPETETDETQIGTPTNVDSDTVKKTI